MAEKTKEKKDQVIVKLPLECRLTEAELKTAGKELAEALSKKAQVESDIETFKQQKKAEVAALDAIVLKNTSLVKSEKEYRQVECEVTFDWKRGKKEFARLDNGDIVRADDITNEERQQMFPGTIV